MTFLQDLGGARVLWSYVVLFVSSIVENLFPPFPGDTVVLLAGYLVGIERLKAAPALLSSATGSMVGASALYALGLAKGRTFFLKGRYPFFSSEHLVQVEEWFHRHGKKVVLASRFLPGVRSLVSVAAGLGHMPYVFFLAYSCASIFVWHGLLLFLGLKLGQNWTQLVGWFRWYSWAVVIVILMIAARWFLRRRHLLRMGRGRSQAGKEPS